MDRIRILVVDDHALFREGLRALLAAFPDIEVVGEAANSEEAIAQAESLQPDVVLMDVAMPGIDGIAATRRILRINPNLGAIRAVAGGQAVFGSAIATRMMNYFQSLDASSGSAATDHAFPELTAREREVLDLIAHGISNAQIAERLVISPKTVSNHITSIFSKLQIADRAQAIIRARDAGLG